MYNPEKFNNPDSKAAFDLMYRFPFATVITAHDSETTISHLPLTPIHVDGKIVLIGHMAKANPQWKSMRSELVTAVFHGHHTYITPQWYAENDVPTWNYSVVHAKGRAEIYENYAELVNCLKTLTEHTETVWPSGWKFIIPDDLPPQILEKSIVGFKITVEELVFKNKLSQNRNEADRAGVLNGLQTRTDEQSLGVLADMQKLYSKNGQKK